MAGRSRHGLHLVRDGSAPSGEPTGREPGPLEHAGVRLQSVVLAVAGRLDADAAGRLRMFLSMFTAEGGPRELVLDLSGVSSVDGEGMAPIDEADHLLSLRAASLRLVSVPAVVAHFLDTQGDRTFLTDRRSLVPGERRGRPGDDDPRPRSDPS